MTTTVKRIKLPRPLEHQLPILQSAARFKVPTCGRRFGKTTIGLLAAVQGHGPGSQLRGAIDGATILWVCPTYPMSNDTWRHLKRAMEGAWTDKSEVERRIELPGDGSITVRSGDDPQSLRGPGYDGAILDECAFLAEEVWTEAVRPTLSDRRGWALFCSTPHGMGWYYELFKRADQRDDWERWQLPTRMNPLIPEEELEQARVELGSLSFLQEYEAKFVSPDSGIFKREWFRVVPAMPTNPDRAVRYWDKAATAQGGDYSCGVLMVEHNGLYIVADVVRGQWSSFRRNEIIEATARRDAEQFGEWMPIWIEQEGGSGGKESAEHTIRQLAGYAVHAERATGDKVTRAQPFAAQCEAGNVCLVEGLWNRDYVDELTLFPAGRHDDQVDATAAGFAKLALGVQNRIEGDLICSGEPGFDEEERRPLTAAEVEELPEPLRGILEDVRAHSHGGRFCDDEW